MMVFSFIFILYVLLSVSVSAENSLVISEVMFNPNGDENAREFIEIHNRSNQPVSIEGCFIGDGDGFDSLVTVDANNRYIPAGAYALVLDPDYFTSNEMYEGIPDNTPLFTVEDKALGSRGLSNSTAEAVYLISSVGDTLSVVRYSLECPAGHSWERVLMHGEDTPDNFKPSKVENGTPGQPNSVVPPSHNPALDKHSLVFYTEQPEMSDTIDIAVSYINAGVETLSNIAVTVTILPDLLLDTITFHEYVEPSMLSEEQTIRVDNLPAGNLGFRATIETNMNNNTTYDDTLYAALHVPVYKGALVLNEIMADPEDGQSEWIEIMNMANAAIDLHGFSIGDYGGSTSLPVADHLFIDPAEMAVLSTAVPENISGKSSLILIERFPVLNNDGDSITLLDCTGAVIDSVRYDKAPEDCSLELISPQMRGNISGWDVCVDPDGATPGSKNSIFFSYVPEDEKPEISSPQIHLEPNPFLHDVNVTYELPFPLARVRMIIYDRRGRKVATLRDVEESGSSWSGIWDGRNDGRRLPAGPYILDFEIQDKRTGKMYRLRETVVVASQL
ncbi:MAG: lamin tail domain-containing protein [Candidatus Latescibacteria bacterium]|nr:lamin tail domain-containing protein [Candidatus Latescibacterota bacterium]